MEKRKLNGWYKLRWQILERDNFTCQYCGRTAPDVMLGVDHRVSLADGGTDALDNLVASCTACNCGKSGLRQSILLARARVIATRERIENSTSQKILNLLRGGAIPVNQIANTLNINHKIVRVRLSHLKARGKVINIQEGVWGLLSNS